MRHVWSVLCRRCEIDAKSSMPSLIEIPDRLAFRGDLPEDRPLNLPLPDSFYFVSTWASEGVHEIHQRQEAFVRILAPNGEALSDFLIPIRFNQASARTTGELNSLPYTENGVYEFEISFKDGNGWKPVASIPLEIIHEGPPEPA